MSDAVVVGSGPNGLACAVALARAGIEVSVLEAAETLGGGTRTSELTLPGLLHDHCSAVHPMAVASPFLRSLELERHGLQWLWPEIDLAHPLDDGTAGVMMRSIADTAAGLGPDGASWKRLFGPSAASFDSLIEEIMGPVVHLPRHPLALARFGLPTLLPAALLARLWRTERARALFGGIAAHAFRPLSEPLSSAIAMAMIVVCHRHGWPVARGGSRAITDALAAELAALGGSIETGARVDSLAELDAERGRRVVVCDLSPAGVADLAAGRLPARVERAYRRYRRGPGAFKVDLAVEGGIPWTNDACRRAGSVHLAGTLEQTAHAEREINRGRMPERPMVLVGQQYLADPGRSAGGVHPIWAYAHVPNGYARDATEALLGQIERFAPGVRERILATSTRSPAELEAYNANYLGGDINAGANDPLQLVFRPRPALDPYRTGIPGVFICSAATPPGAGIHGMSGFNAARSALRWLEREGQVVVK